MCIIVKNVIDRAMVYLHEGFGIITHPLFKSMAFRKLPQASKRGGGCNTG
jgi:hypothetical protein